MTIGQRLRAAREEKGMSIGDVARRTCIQPKFLHALDEDNLGVIPDSHRKLFVREYAKALELDPAEFLSQLPDYVPPPPPPEPTHTTGARVLSTPPPATFDSDRKEYREILHRLSSGKGIALARSNSALWLIVGACLLLAAGGIYYFFGRADEPEPAGTANAPADTTATAPVDSTDAEAADTAAAALQTGKGGDSLILEGRATAPVWYSIVMDGKRSEQGTVDSGGTKVWRAAETFRISLGNAGGLSLTLNDKPIGTLGLKKTIVRNQLIDATGIVKKGTPHRTAPAAQHRPAAQGHAITTTTLRPARISEGR